LQVRRVITQSDFTDRHTFVQTDGDLKISAAVGDAAPPRALNREADVRRIQTALRRR
jgi:hypothetical protein